MMGHTRRRFLASGAATLGVLVAGCSGGGDGGSSGETHTVEMTGELEFVPDSITIAPDDTVVWENVDPAPHTVTASRVPAEAEYFASADVDSEQAARTAYSSDRRGEITEGETYEHTFAVEGGYGYYCIRHANRGMSGTVVVSE